MREVCADNLCFRVFFFWGISLATIAFIGEEWFSLSFSGALLSVL